MSYAVGFVVGVPVVFGVVVSPVFGASIPVIMKLVLGSFCTGATIGAYPSFWPGMGQSFCW